MSKVEQKQESGKVATAENNCSDESAQKPTQQQQQDETTKLVEDDIDSKLGVEDLNHLCSLRGYDAVTKLNGVFGGIEKLSRLLKTNLQSGLDETDKDSMSERLRKYGRNEIPTAASKPFWKLVFEAFRDPTLVMLMLCAFISIGLAFYHTDEHIPQEEHLHHHANSSALVLSSNSSSNSVVAAKLDEETNSESSIQWIEGIGLLAIFLLLL